MIVGIRQWDLQLYGCHSLKDKRSILQSLKAGLRNGLNVAVAETGHQDDWQRLKSPAPRWRVTARWLKKYSDPPTGSWKGRTEFASLIR